MPESTPFHLAVALADAGWHPAAWRATDAGGGDLLAGDYWGDLIVEAERGLLDFVTIEDAPALQSARPGTPDDRADQVRGRLDSLLVAAYTARLTKHIGLVPATTVHTDPFRLATTVASLDHLIGGRLGWRPLSAAHGVSMPGPRRTPPRFAGPRDPGVAEYLIAAFTEGTESLNVVRKLWDSWADNALLADTAGGRYLDPAKVRSVDEETRWFTIDGPSTVPRSPQGRPVVVALSHAEHSHRFAVNNADVVFLTPRETDTVPATVNWVRKLEAETGRSSPLRVFADIVVFLDETEEAARTRLKQLDALAGAEITSDALIFTGTPEGLADLLADWYSRGVEGFRIRPGVSRHDLPAITRGVVPILQARGLFRSGYEATTLRGRLGLPRPAVGAGIP